MPQSRARRPVQRRTRGRAADPRRDGRPVLRRPPRRAIRQPHEPDRQHVFPLLPGGTARIVQESTWTFADMDSLDAQLDEAKIATGQVRTLREFADSDWARV